jgi:putative membrane protein
VFLAASVAVCALVVPGVSGSFLLLAVGMYTTTLGAVEDRDLLYLAVFGAGAVLGLGSFVQVLRYLLNSHRRTTLLVMSGLMIGSLRALWPWQSTSGGGGEAEGPGQLVAPYAPVLGPVLLALLGAAVVGILVLVQIRADRKAAESSQD